MKNLSFSSFEEIDSSRRKENKGTQFISPSTCFNCFSRKLKPK